MINYDFLKNNKQNLIDIYIKEKFVENNGKDGALVVNFSIQDKMNVYYLSVDNMPTNIRNKFIEDYNKDFRNVPNKKKVFLLIYDNGYMESSIHYL